MKQVLFVGEGDHDIGKSGEAWGQPRPAGGVVTTLARKVCPAIDKESLALTWREIPRFSPEAKRGFEAKIAAAIAISARRLGLEGTVCVTDRDGDLTRHEALERGKRNGLGALAKDHAVAVGVAIESIEAWTLGATRALAEELGLDDSKVRDNLPKKPVETLRESSGKEEHRPKRVLEQLANLTDRDDHTAFRTSVAERTDIGELCATCPEGFGKFAQELVAAFGAST